MLRSEPYFDEWKEQILPYRCRLRIDEVMTDILGRGDRTRFQKIYDAIYELVEGDIEEEHIEEQGDNT